MLERSQPAPADGVGGAAHRVRNSGGVGLYLSAAPDPPPLLTLAGIVCLIAGVVYAMRIKPQPVVVALEDKQGNARREGGREG